MSLNPAQKIAAEFSKGIACVIAVPGSGKTHTMTARIVNLVESGVKPENILGLTFTKKAANSMKERCKKVLNEKANGILLTTIHSFAYNLLRNEEVKFNILTGKEEIKFLRKILKENNITNISVGNALKDISFLKNRLISVESLKNEAQDDPYKFNLAKVYELYDIEKRKINKLDFNDLLEEACKILENPEIRRNYQERYKHILVDEFQDTTPLQLKLIKLLTIREQNDDNFSLWVCGDDWQSIYSFTGATVDNILNFHIDFPDRKLFFLNQNYRSTPEILKICQNLISHNIKKIEKKLITENKSGDFIQIISTKDEDDEVKFIINQIKELVNSKVCEYKDIGILFRTNSQSRLIEENLILAGIPYNSDNSINFYNRSEVKNLINYLILIRNPDSFEGDNALIDIINVPNRFISRSFIDNLKEYAHNNQLSLYSALKQIQITDARLKDTIQHFIKIIDELNQKKDKIDTANLIKTLRVLLDYDNFITEDEILSPDESRIGNVNQFEYAATKYPLLDTFLMYISKFLGASGNDENGVRVMTIHKSKGLEFQVVFVTGFFDGMIPHKSGEIEEERRIAFVALSRAMKKLYITFPLNSMDKPVKKSLFLYELFAPLELEPKIHIKNELFI